MVGFVIHRIDAAVLQAEVVAQLVQKRACLLFSRACAPVPATERDQKIARRDAARATCKHSNESAKQ